MGLLWALGGTLIFAVLAGIITKSHEVGLCVGFVFFVASCLGTWIFGDIGAAIIIWTLGIICDGKLFEETAADRQHRRDAKLQEKCRPLKEKILQDLARQKGILNAQRSKLRDKAQTDEIALAFLDLVALCDHDTTFLDQVSINQRRNEHSALLATQRSLDLDIAQIDAQRKKVKDCTDYQALKAMANSTQNAHA